MNKNFKLRFTHSNENSKKMGFTMRIGVEVVVFNNGVAEVDAETASFVRKNMAKQFHVSSESGVAPKVNVPDVVHIKEEPEEVVSDDDDSSIAVGDVLDDPEEAIPATRVKVKSKAKPNKKKPKAKKRG